eukprot:gene21914-28956_t
MSLFSVELEARARLSRQLAWDLESEPMVAGTMSEIFDRIVETVSDCEDVPLAIILCDRVVAVSKAAFGVHKTVSDFKNGKASPTPLMRLCQRICTFAQVAQGVFRLVAALKASQPAASSTWKLAKGMWKSLAAYLWARPTTSPASATPPGASATPTASASSSGLTPPSPRTTFPAGISAAMPPEASAKPTASTSSSGLAPPSPSPTPPSSSTSLPAGISAATIFQDYMSTDTDSSTEDDSSSEDEDWMDADCDFHTSLPSPIVKLSALASWGWTLFSWGQNFTITGARRA